MWVGLNQSVEGLNGRKKQTVLPQGEGYSTNILPLDMNFNSSLSLQIAGPPLRFSTRQPLQCHEQIPKKKSFYIYLHTFSFVSWKTITNTGIFKSAYSIVLL